MQCLPETEARAQALIDAASQERQRMVEHALAAVRDAEAHSSVGVEYSRVSVAALPLQPVGLMWTDVSFFQIKVLRAAVGTGQRGTSGGMASLASIP